MEHKSKDMKKSEPTEPWKPAPILDTPQRPGFRRRWVRKDRLRKKLLEKWSIVEAPDDAERRIIEGTQIGSRIERGNLVLCEMPEEIAKQRDAYYRDLTDSALQTKTKEYKDRFGPNETYGEGAQPDYIE